MLWEFYDADDAVSPQALRRKYDLPPLPAGGAIRDYAEPASMVLLMLRELVLIERE